MLDVDVDLTGDRCLQIPFKLQGMPVATSERQGMSEAVGSA